MEKKRLIIIVTVAVVLLGTAVGLTTWLVLRLLGRFSRTYDTIHLEGDGVGSVEQRAAFTRFRTGAHLFWWFFPAEAEVKEDRPIIMWLDGVAELPPSLLANFVTVGPYDFNMNRRENTWISDYNLLLVDAPVGSGFSFVREEGQAPADLRENSEDLVRALHSFLSEYEDAFSETPLYIYGQGYGGKMATDFTLLLNEYIATGVMECNLQGVILSNPIISPAIVTNSTGFYLEQMGYVDDAGRAEIESLAGETLSLVDGGRYEEAYDTWAGLQRAVEVAAQATAVNLNRIVDKMQRESTLRDNCMACSRFEGVTLPTLEEASAFMDAVVAPALGVVSGVGYHQQRAVASRALLAEFMKPAHQDVERILQETELGVWIYNGNLDAISNTPGQMNWIESLSWSGSEEWSSAARVPISINGTLEGHQRSTDRLHLYWINVAGHAVAIDNPTATRLVLDSLTSS